MNANDSTATLLARGPWFGELRAPFELASLPSALPFLLAVPRGDRHGVLVLPGLGAGDRSTQPLRSYLRALGYRPSPWGLGPNRGPTPEIEGGLDALIRKVADATGAAVSLVGWSLGGVLAWRLARRHPDLVRALITLGSPLAEALRPDLGAPPAPTTTIYSRTDAVVPWRLSRLRPRPLVENVEVRSSHLGLGVNPLVLHVVADRLAQPAGDWRPFERTGPRALLFPDPERAG